MTMITPADIHLAFFLSRATPLNRWYTMGILEREIAIYRSLSYLLGSVSIVTSGGPEEQDHQPSLGNARLLYNRWGLSPNSYSLLAPWLHRSALRQATIYKTNQPDGAWTGIIAGKIHRKPVVVRAGYLWAEFNRDEGGRGFNAALMDKLQAFSFEKANRVLLTTEAMKQQVACNYRVPPDKITVIPNYVDTQKFKPMPEVVPIKGRVCYVGRLHPRKNLDLLIKAIAPRPELSLVLMGQGEQQPQLEQFARQGQSRVEFMGVMPHDQIPLEINKSEIFILPSSFEGHPKSLIEAMACGAAVIATDVEGNRQVIKHRQTGLLCAPTTESIQAALMELVADQPLRQRLGRAAAEFARQEYSLDRVVQQELALLQAVQAGHQLT